VFKPRVLLLTNESKPGDASGQINGFELLVSSGEIRSCNSTSHIEGYDKFPAHERVMNALTNFDYDVVVLWTPKVFPSDLTKFEEIINKINGRPVLYWEGDPWSSNKKPKITIQMSWWMSHSSIVFSTVSQPHVDLFKQAGAKHVSFCPNTYCHIKFAEQEIEPPPKLETGYKADVCVIASNTSRIPGVSGLPGNMQRWELVTRLRFDTDLTSNLFGRNWPRNWSMGYLPYSEQAREIRRYRMSLNWDHFPEYRDYSSDRLPIALIAGRPHISTKHPGMHWAPEIENGFFQEESPKNMIVKAQQLLDLDSSQLWKIGFEAYKWARFRISHRESARYIMSQYFNHIKSPPNDPWGNLPGPW